MLSPNKVFRLLSELVFVLLGVLLVWLAATGRFASRFLSDRHSPAWIGLGAFLIYWGLRAWWHVESLASRADNRVRGGSLALVGALMLGIAGVPFRWVAPLLGASGGILVVRGLVSAALLARVR